MARGHLPLQPDCGFDNIQRMGKKDKRWQCTTCGQIMDEFWEGIARSSVSKARWKELLAKPPLSLDK